MLEKLRSVNVDKMDIDDLVELAAFGQLARTTYSAYEVPTPEWLTDALKTLDADIKRRRRDALEARRKQIKARRAGLRTAAEERADLDAEDARLAAALGITPEA
jgi:hypothetical protein